MWNIAWNVTPCSSTEVHGRFRETYGLLVHDVILIPVSKQSSEDGDQAFTR
jgi:hypothetical protein